MVRAHENLVNISYPIAPTNHIALASAAEYSLLDTHEATTARHRHGHTHRLRKEQHAQHLKRLWVSRPPAMEQPPEASKEVHFKFQVHNDLKAAMEVNVGADWKVLYPFHRLELEAVVLDVEVRLRDAPEIWGSCHAVPGALLWTSKAFGDFGPAARKFIEEEQKAAEKERQCHQQRFQKILEKVKKEQTYRKIEMLACTFVVVVVLGILAGVQPGNYVVAVLLSFVAAGLLCCVCSYGVGWGEGMHSWDVAAVQEAGRLGTVHHVQRYVVFFSYVGPFLAAACIIVMAVLYSMNGFPLVALILWISCCCCTALRGNQHCWPVDGDIFGDAKNMIIFEGKVLGSRPCVCSWPGKYESAWDVLVESSRRGSMSAAVVFLPEGSTEYGHHDLKYPDDEDEGCWCRTLYGERNPWGCRWWTHWIANIEEAVKQGAELEVYFFEKKKGQGKVQSFETAGQEHMRREAINGRKKEFEDSLLFKDAKDAGLRELSKDKVADGSSQYSREYQRLFLSWLPEDDREFLEASEGLGNSQKAEVAWLEKKGYAYTEVEIDVAKWLRDSNVSRSETSPEVIGLPAV